MHEPKKRERNTGPGLREARGLQGNKVQHKVVRERDKCWRPKSHGKANKGLNRGLGGEWPRGESSHRLSGNLILRQVASRGPCANRTSWPRKRKWNVCQDSCNGQRASPRHTAT